ncbi:hypothetical protein I2F27_12335 [Acinetobacter sp. B5B]|uniref:hypothetical protein n=1 Tax=Acinetobacter baretiae TaxID=2605383 RepID=UPI0018C20CD6|nr:hypothetical protein [Acinetobacter baretiae]MBF7684077.1 hypothetical protein [Acinetobacter baretiae]
MKKLSIDQNNPLIKSWFGFFLGLITVGLSFDGLSESLTFSRVLSTLGILCFWYSWTQITWNTPIKNFFKANAQAMSKSCTYLAVTGVILLLSSIITSIGSIK